jgi:hypothetical protein
MKQGFPEEVQTDNLPNTSLENYHYTNLLSEKILHLLCYVSETKMTGGGESSSGLFQGTIMPFHWWEISARICGILAKNQTGHLPNRSRK